MDQEVLVTEFRKVIKILKQGDGHVALFMLKAFDAYLSSWNLIVSATEYDSLTTKQALKHFLPILQNTLKKDILRQIFRVTILKTHDPFVKAVNETFKVRNTATYLQSAVISGVDLENAIILPSKQEITTVIEDDPEFGQIENEINNLVQGKGFPFKRLKGSSSWCNSKRDSRTLLKLCFLGQHKAVSERYVFGIRESYVIDNKLVSEIESISDYMFNLIPQRNDDRFYGVYVRNNDESKEKIRRIINLMPPAD